jgi:hypothetical protein
LRASRECYFEANRDVVTELRRISRYEELHNLLSSLNVISVIDSRRINGTEEPDERHMSRWEHNTKVDHK